MGAAPEPEQDALEDSYMSEVKDLSVFVTGSFTPLSNEKPFIVKLIYALGHSSNSPLDQTWIS